jgi:hypothetical protein
VPGALAFWLICAGRLCVVWAFNNARLPAKRPATPRQRAEIRCQESVLARYLMRSNMLT